jgi:hypothetical protein
MTASPSAKKRSIALALIIPLFLTGLGLAYMSISSALTCLAIQVFLLSLALVEDNGMLAMTAWLMGPIWGSLCIISPRFLDFFSRADAKHFSLLPVTRRAGKAAAWTGGIFVMGITIMVILAPTGGAPGYMSRSEREAYLKERQAEQEGVARVMRNWEAAQRERQRIQRNERWREEVRRGLY